jgi:hypothetical protein
MKKIYAVLLSALTVWGCGGISGEQPESRYVVTKQDEKNQQIEYRRYAPMIIAEVTATGNRDDAANKGFRILADYIFGENTKNSEIAMTSPVIQKNTQGQDIAMTTPVRQNQTENNIWTVQFVMPSEYTMDTLPKPNNKDIRFVTNDAYDAAVIKFSGFWSDDNMQEHLNMLQTHLKNNNMTATGSPTFAYYNPPWTLWFLRRNEIILPIESNKK